MTTDQALDIRQQYIKENVHELTLDVLNYYNFLGKPMSARLLYLVDDLPKQLDNKTDIALVVFTIHSTCNRILLEFARKYLRK